MHVKVWPAALAVAIVWSVASLQAAAQGAPATDKSAGYIKNRVYVDNQSLVVGKPPYQLMKGKTAFTFQAIEAPTLADSGTPYAELQTTLTHMGEVGANSVCFNLPGLSADGTSIAPEAVASFRKALDEIIVRRMGPICRIFAADAPQDAAYREKAVVTAASALGQFVDCLYWIDGPDAAALVEKFKQAAPNLTVAAEKGGDVDVVKQVPTAQLTRPLLLTDLVALPDNGDVNYVMPGTEDTYRQFELAMAAPIEHKPWTPDNSVLSEEERNEGFISLFNGKDLSGWYIVGNNKEGFAARDGMIEWVAPGASLMRTRDRYDNFVLRMDWKIAKGKNSGVQVHLPRAGRGSKLGLEVQMLGYRIEPPTNDSTGSIYDVVPPKVDASKEPGEWNSLELTINWPRLTCTMNGVLVQDIDMDQNEELRNRLKSGFIGVTDHGGYVAFRNIRVKPLK